MSPAFHGRMTWLGNPPNTRTPHQVAGRLKICEMGIERDLRHELEHAMASMWLVKETCDLPHGGWPERSAVFSFCFSSLPDSSRPLSVMVLLD